MALHSLQLLYTQKGAPLYVCWVLCGPKQPQILHSLPSVAVVGCSVLHVLQHGVPVATGRRILVVRHPEVRVPAGHDYERRRHVHGTGGHIFLERARCRMAAGISVARLPREAHLHGGHDLRGQQEGDVVQLGAQAELDGGLGKQLGSGNHLAI